MRRRCENCKTLAAMVDQGGVVLREALHRLARAEAEVERLRGDVAGRTLTDDLLIRERATARAEQRARIAAWLRTPEALALATYYAPDGSVSYGLGRVADAVEEGR